MLYLNFGFIGMDLGFFILLISLFAFILDIIFVFLGEYFEKWEFYSKISLNIGSLALISSFLYFSYSIIQADYNFVYVSNVVNNEMDLILRISAIWSGQVGSYFFWAFLATLLYLLFRKLFQDYIHETFFWRSFMLMAIQVAILTLLTIIDEPFRLNTTPMTDGIGLNPVLMNIWNFIHPPIIFIGYALCIIPMVIGIVRISLLEEGKIPNFEGKEKLDGFFDFMISIAWLILSSGIIIGAYWAYITLGWGGFWAWDPVETVSLIPWLFLTLYYHGKSFHNKNPFLGNYIITMTYVSTLFATYLTRSGIISSVHAFQPEGTLENLLALLIPKNSFLMSIILRFIPNEKILVLFVVILIFFLLPHIIGIQKGEIRRISIKLTKTDFQADKLHSVALKFSYIVLFIGIYLIIIGLITPVFYDILGYLITFSPEGFDVKLTIDPIFYNTILTIFGGTMLCSQFFCSFYPQLSVKRKITLLISGVILGIFFAISGFFYRNGALSSILGPKNPILLILDNIWTTSDKANLVIPLILLGLIGIFAEFINIALKEEKQLIRKTSRIMLHFSFLVIILGSILSANKTITQELEFVQEGGTYNIPATSLSIQILDLTQTYPETGLLAVVYDTAFVLLQGSRPIAYGVSRLGFDRVGRRDSTVTIISDLFSDIYIITYATYENVIIGGFAASGLRIKLIPYINILWAGCIILHFAIIPLTVERFINFKTLNSLKKSVEKEYEVETPLNPEKTDIGDQKSG